MSGMGVRGEMEGVKFEGMEGEFGVWGLGFRVWGLGFRV